MLNDALGHSVKVPMELIQLLLTCDLASQWLRSTTSWGLGGVVVRELY